MNRLPHLMLAGLALALCAMPTHGIETIADQSRVLMVIRDDSRDQDFMLEQEALVMKNRIEAAGYVVDVATTTDEPLTGDVTIEPDLMLDAIKLERYAGLMLPCMAPVPGTPMPAKVVDLIERANDLGLPIGASRGSVAGLASAGALVGHRYSYASAVNVDERPAFRGATYMGTGVTSDQRIATAGICPLAARVLGEPDGTVKLTDAFVELLTARHQ